MTKQEYNNLKVGDLITKFNDTFIVTKINRIVNTLECKLHIKRELKGHYDFYDLKKDSKIIEYRNGKLQYSS